MVRCCGLRRDHVRNLWSSRYDGRRRLRHNRIRCRICDYWSSRCLRRLCGNFVRNGCFYRCWFDRGRFSQDRFNHGRFGHRRFGLHRRCGRCGLGDGRRLYLWRGLWRSSLWLWCRFCGRFGDAAVHCVQCLCGGQHGRSLAGRLGGGFGRCGFPALGCVGQWNDSSCCIAQ